MYLVFGIVYVVFGTMYLSKTSPSLVCSSDERWWDPYCCYFWTCNIYISVYLVFGICGMYLSNAIPRSAVPASVGEILTVGHLQSAKWSRQSTAAHSSLWSNTYFAQVLLAQLDWPSSDRWLFVISEKYDIVNSFVLNFCSTCISILNPDITQGDLHNWTVDQTRLSDFVLLVISGW